MINVEKSINETLQRILKVASYQEIVKFSQLLTERSSKEVVKILLSCLHLANRGRIRIWQEEEFGEILITLINGGFSK
jgi:chromatin segregation and condensation protein Rec8/ScpA/Scc1 (kleisin family)